MLLQWQTWMYHFPGSMLLKGDGSRQNISNVHVPRYTVLLFWSGQKQSLVDPMREGPSSTGQTSLFPVSVPCLLVVLLATPTQNLADLQSGTTATLWQGDTIQGSTYLVWYHVVQQTIVCCGRSHSCSHIKQSSTLWRI